MGEGANLLRRKIPNNFCTYSTIKELEDNTFVLWFGMHIMTSFWKYNMQRGKRVSLVENPDKHYLRQVIRLTSTVKVMLIVCTFNMMWWEWHFNLVVFLLKTPNPHVTMRETSDRSPLIKQSAKYFTSIPQNCQDNQSQESQKVSQLRGVLGDLMTKCNMVFWNRKRTLGKK